MMNKTEERIWSKEMMLGYIDKCISEDTGLDGRFNSLDEKRGLIAQRNRVARFLRIGEDKTLRDFC